METLIKCNETTFRKVLQNWYKTHKRNLPWRSTSDPYKIWVSEIILQQTQVIQGEPYYKRFITAYPCLKTLANSTEQEVLRLWQGLGYYSRARHLYHCAQTLCTKYDGKFPDTYQKLRQLKGIGPYTAAAIASIAFKQAVAVVDGNVCRLLTRLFGLTCNINTSHGKNVIDQLANKLLDPKDPATHNQAIMDFGALQCKPKLPLCSTCMFQPYCKAFHTSKQHILPIKTNKIIKKTRYFTYYILQYQDTFYMRRRDKGDIWQGLYDFYLIEGSKRILIDHSTDPLIALAKQHQLPIIALKPDHVQELTHQKLSIQFYKTIVCWEFLQQAKALLQTLALRPFTITEIHTLPKPRLIQEIFQKYVD